MCPRLMTLWSSLEFSARTHTRECCPEDLHKTPTQPTPAGTSGYAPPASGRHWSEGEVIPGLRKALASGPWTHTPPASRRTRWARTVLLGLASLKRNSICHLVGNFLYGWTWAGACFVSTSFGQSAKPSLGALLRVRVRKCLERFLGVTFYSGDILSAAPLHFIWLQILSGFILSSWPFIPILSAPFYLKTPLQCFR